MFYGNELAIHADAYERYGNELVTLIANQKIIEKLDIPAKSRALKHFIDKVLKVRPDIKI